ncbi:MAG: hypothetical protein H6817_05815 [Phycisphaerales bacterium]|nr:hypothetical protein [Phycisphaerales bacterium]
MTRRMTRQTVTVIAFVFAATPLLAQVRDTAKPTDRKPAVQSGEKDAAHAQSNASSTTDRSKASPKEANADDIAAIRVMNERIEQIKWVDEPLETVLDWLRDQGPINVIVMWQMLDRQAIDRETPVSLEMRDATVHEILRELCDQLSTEVEVGFRAYGNTIKFSTSEYFERKLYTRVYDVTDLIWAQDEFAPNCAASVVAGSPGRGEIDTYELPEVRRAEVEELIQHLMMTNEWAADDNGWSVRVWRNNLIVRAPLSVHQQIAGAFYGQ